MVLMKDDGDDEDADAGTNQLVTAPLLPPRAPKQHSRASSQIRP